MITQKDLLALQAALEEEVLSTSQALDSLVWTQKESIPLGKSLIDAGLVTAENWTRFGLRESQLYTAHYTPRYYQWENQLLLENLCANIHPGAQQPLYSLFGEAQQAGESFLNLLLDKNLLSAQELEKILDMRPFQKLSCQHCEYTLVLDCYFPWRSYFCPLCQEEFQVLSDSIKESEGQSYFPPFPGSEGEEDLHSRPPRFEYNIRETLSKNKGETIYLAYDPRLGRPVILKVLSVLEFGPPQWNHFSRQMRRAASLRHPHITPLYDWGAWEEKPYVVTTYQKGINLKKYLKEKGALSSEEALKLTIQAADALEYAHGEEVLHGNLQLKNLFLNPEGKISLGDFGLHGRLLSSSPGVTEDIRGLGKILHTLLAGQSPPEESLQESFSTKIHTILYRCLHPSPSERYPQVNILKFDLQSALKGGPLWARPSPLWRRERRGPRRPWS